MSYNYEGLCKQYIEYNLHNKGKSHKNTAGKKMSYRMDRLYSYNSILCIYVEIKSEKIFFIDNSTANYSITSSKHKRILKEKLQQEQNNQKEQFTYMEIKQIDSTKNMIKSKHNTIVELIQRHDRARSNKPIIKKIIKNEYDNLKLLCSLIDQRTRESKLHKEVFKLLIKHKIA